MVLSETVGNNAVFRLVPWTVFLPAMGLVINLLIGRRAGEKASAWVACLASGLVFLLSVLLASTLAGHPEAVVVNLAPGSRPAL
ncbi:MAG: hypothetical protein AB9891_07655 [Anaerolineaceae bacterium]